VAIAPRARLLRGSTLQPQLLLLNGHCASSARCLDGRERSRGGISRAGCGTPEAATARYQRTGSQSSHPRSPGPWQPLAAGISGAPQRVEAIETDRVRRRAGSLRRAKPRPHREQHRPKVKRPARESVARRAPSPPPTLARLRHRALRLAVVLQPVASTPIRLRSQLRPGGGGGGGGTLSRLDPVARRRWPRRMDAHGRRGVHPMSRLSQPQRRA
jgi:hypothetical protein